MGTGVYDFRHRIFALRYCNLPCIQEPPLQVRTPKIDHLHHPPGFQFPIPWLWSFHYIPDSRGCLKK